MAGRNMIHHETSELVGNHGLKSMDLYRVCRGAGVASDPKVRHSWFTLPLDAPLHAAPAVKLHFEQLGVCLLGDYKFRFGIAGIMDHHQYGGISFRWQTEFSVGIGRHHASIQCGGVICVIDRVAVDIDFVAWCGQSHSHR